MLSHCCSIIIAAYCNVQRLTAARQSLQLTATWSRSVGEGINFAMALGHYCYGTCLMYSMPELMHPIKAGVTAICPDMQAIQQKWDHEVVACITTAEAWGLNRTIPHCQD